eukprot:COSAG02_NODE_6290_length_3673_cov_1.705932_2_plen_537_part_00
MELTEEPDRERVRALARAVIDEIVEAAVQTRPTAVQAAGRARAAVWKLAESDCEGARARQNPRWRRIATLAATAASAAARASPPPSDDDCITQKEMERWRTQCTDQPPVGDLSTLIKLLGVASLRTRAIRDLHTIAASPLRAHEREVEEHAIPIARRLGSLLASGDEGAVRCGAMGVAALARHDAVRASLFHAGDVERVVNLASATRPPSAPGGLMDWQREERKEASAQRACHEATLRMKAAIARAETQMKVAKKADDQLKQRLREMEDALQKANDQEADAASANAQADREVEVAEDAESHAAGEVDPAGQSLAAAEQEQAEAENAAAVAAAQLLDATDAKAQAEAAEARATKSEEQADAALQAQQTAEAELAEALRILKAGLVTDGEREGKKMNKQEKKDAEAIVAAKQEQLSSAPASEVVAPVEQAALDAAQAGLAAAENKKARIEAEAQVAEKHAALQSAKSAGVTRAKEAAVELKAGATAAREDADRQKETAGLDKAEADARVAKAQQVRKAAETVLADKKHALVKAVDELQ